MIYIYDNDEHDDDINDNDEHDDDINDNDEHMMMMIMI